MQISEVTGSLLVQLIGYQMQVAQGLMCSSVVKEGVTKQKVLRTWKKRKSDCQDWENGL